MKLNRKGIVATAYLTSFLLLFAFLLMLRITTDFEQKERIHTLQQEIYTNITKALNKN